MGVYLQVKFKSYFEEQFTELLFQSDFFKFLLQMKKKKNKGIFHKNWYRQVFLIKGTDFND